MIWLNRAPHLLLASASPRRVELLQQIQVPTKQVFVPSPVGEDEPRYVNETVIEYVIRTTDDKLARALDYVKQQNELQPLYEGESLPILTADTTVAIDQTMLGKPTDTADAARMLSILSGNTHSVYTAISLHYSNQTHRALSHSTVTFEPIGQTQIEQYVASREPFGKAGAYAIQGLGAQFVTKLEGSFSAVMGLPLFELTQILRRAGLIS